MEETYRPADVEATAQQYWDEHDCFRAVEDPAPMVEVIEEVEQREKIRFLDRLGEESSGADHDIDGPRMHLLNEDVFVAAQSMS